MSRRVRPLSRTGAEALAELREQWLAETDPRQRLLIEEMATRIKRLVDGGLMPPGR